MSVKEEKIFLTKFELDSLLSFSSLREKLIIHILYETGCKLQELPLIKIKHINFVSNKLIFGFKSHKRTAYFSKETKKLLKEYIILHPSKQKNSFLFYSKDSPQITTRRIEQLFFKIGIKANIRFTPRILRTTAIIHKINKGISLDDIKKISGLNSLSKYLALIIERGWTQ